jgi:hypothetical protein
MGMDKVIEKKKGLRPKHLIWTAVALALVFYCSKLSCRGVFRHSGLIRINKL